MAQWPVNIYMWEAVNFSKSSLVKSYTSKTLQNLIPNGSVASEHIYVGSQRFWQEQGYVNLSKSPRRSEKASGEKLY